MNLCYRPALTIIDGSVGQDGEGPLYGDKADLQVLVAGRDSLAVDLVACQLVGVKPRAIPHLKLALEQRGKPSWTITGEAGEEISVIKKFRLPRQKPLYKFIFWLMYPLDYPYTWVAERGKHLCTTLYSTGLVGTRPHIKEENLPVAASASSLPLTQRDRSQNVESQSRHLSTLPAPLRSLPRASDQCQGLLGSAYMTILVTGATGFLGSALVAELVRLQQPVRILARDVDKARAQFGDAVTIVAGDITETQQVRQAVQGVTVIYHLVGHLYHPSVPTELYHTTHVEGTRTLLAACKGQPQLQRIVHCSTTGVHGVTGNAPVAEDAPFAPTNPYEATKLESERSRWQPTESRDCR